MTTAVVDATLEPGERDRLLAEVQKELPLWLGRAAIRAEDPLAELTDLLRFDPVDLRRAVAVHTCTDPIVQAFAEHLPGALRAPIPNTERPQETAAAVRGPIDWPATVQLHATGRVGSYVSRPRRRTLDTPEHRALRWVLRVLDGTVATAKLPSADGADVGSESITSAVGAIRKALRVAARTEWLRAVPVEFPTTRTRQRLQRSRNEWVRSVLAPAVELLLRRRHLDPQELAALLRQRYFVPERDWLLHEVVVLIRLDRALSDADTRGKRRTFFSEAGVVAVYQLADGSEIHLRQQNWPARGLTSRRQVIARRHGFDVRPSKPDIMVERIGPNPDLVVLELKASRVPSTLGGGLAQLLGYLSERPDLFDRHPAGWLVPLPWEQLTKTEPDPDESLWVVAADRVADAVVARFVSGNCSPCSEARHADPSERSYKAS